jgi:2-polyprenyl-6-methoxyphenol hydroxylase-like FAD-dependent oxidoreductase
MISTLIVGGGIGGLSLARELANRGLPATVLERAPQVNPVGAGIIMNPNAMRVLERNGLADAVRADSWPYLCRETCDERGRRLAVRDYRPLYDAGTLARGALVHRAHLLGVLLRSLSPEAVRFGVDVTGVEVMPDGVRARSARGEVFQADVLVGADGIHSQVRSQLFGKVLPAYMGYRSHRFVVDNTAVPHFTEFLGHGRRVGLVPISEKRLYVWTTFNSPYDSPPPLQRAEDVRALFDEFTDERVRRVFSQLRSVEGVILTEIEELRLERWTQGRAVLLGDSVHAMTPNIGQGAGMAMEDAAVLAAELATASAPQAALEGYARRRRPRVEAVMRISRDVGSDGQRSNPLSCWLRNRRIRRAGRDVQKSLADLERLLAHPV